MKIEGFTPGPWSARQPDGNYRSSDEWDSPDNDGSSSSTRIDIWSGDSVVAMALESDGNESICGDSEHEANAELIADAPAMQLVLALICAGKAELCKDKDDGPPYLIMQDGITDDVPFFDITGTYTDLLNAVGWDLARAAIEGVRHENV